MRGVFDDIIVKVPKQTGVFINSTFAPNYLALVSDEIRAYG